MNVLLALAALALAEDGGNEGASEKDKPVPTGTALLIGSFQPDDSLYPVVMLMADYGYLHVEGRYNYEGGLTGSLWGGANFAVGNDDWWFWVTPMAGVVFGSKWGITPGWRFDLGWKAFDLYSEFEVMIDLVDVSKTFIYAWTEINVRPVDFARFGLVLQRTNAFGDPHFFQPGAFVGFNDKDGVVGASVYFFGFGWLAPTVITLSIAITI